MLKWFSSLPESRSPGACPVCGGTEFDQLAVLTERLIADWQLDPEEVSYINMQQGHICTACRSNLRSRTLAAALLEHCGYSGTLKGFCAARQGQRPRLLELNEAGALSPWLARMRGRTLASYPDVDIHELPYADMSWDIVIHSDVLEHVADPVQALKECRRVLVDRGVLLYSIPIVHGRLSRSREGLSASYHGTPGETKTDMLVHTEYGADFWLHPMYAGFRDVKLYTLANVDSLAIVCRKHAE